MPSALPPRRRIHPAHCSAFSGTTSTQTTVAPSPARPCAIPPPMFGLVPVTIAIFPASFTRASLASSGRLPRDARLRDDADPGHRRERLVHSTAASVQPVLTRRSIGAAFRGARAVRHHRLRDRDAPRGLGGVRRRDELGISRLSIRLGSV